MTEPSDVGFVLGSGSENHSTVPNDSNGLFVNVSCVSRKKTSFLLFSCVPSSSILINMVVLIAVAMDSRRLLRQSRVYAHVSSTLIANVTFSIFALVQILSLYFNFEGHGDDPRLGYQGAVKKELIEWWAFRKAFLYGMYIIMCGNIGLLIGAIRSSTCIALRSAAGAVHLRPAEASRFQKTILFMRFRRMSSKNHDTAVPSSRVTRRRRSYIMITLLWILPVGYVLAPTIGWSCAHACTCLSSCFPEDQLWKPPVRGCSRAFPPMSNSWLALTIGIWAVGLVGVFVMLKRSIVILRRMRQKHSVGNDVMFSSVVAGSSAILSDDVFTPDNNSEKEKHGLITTTAETLNCNRKIENGDEKVDVDSNLTSRTHRPQKIRSVSRSSVPQAKNETHVNKREGKRSSSSRSSVFGGIFSSDGRSLLRKSRPVTRSIGQLLEMSSSLKYVIWLTVAFAICTAPPMIYLAVDMIFLGLKLNMIVLNTCLLFPFIYCLTCPFLLIKCLPGVKSSLVHLIPRFCTYTTTVKRDDSR